MIVCKFIISLVLAVQLVVQPIVAISNLKTHNDGRGLQVRDAKYDALNQPTEITDGENNLTKFQYDGGGLMLSKTEPKGNAYRTNYSYNALGSLVSVTDANAKTWKFEYDNAQNLRFVKDALHETDAARVTEYQYDTLNRLTKTILPTVAGQSRETTYGYDNNSNLTSITDPKSQTVQMNYDLLDRLDDATYTGSGQQLVHDYKYDAEDNLFEVIETKNTQARTYRREYDTRNRLKKTTDGNGKSVSFTFDFANNLKTITDATNRVTTYNYDGKNQLDKVVQNGANIADYDWFADGLLQKVSYQNSTNRNYQYDNADRVRNITNNFGANQTESFDYGYDANSNRTSEIKKANGQAFKTIGFDYDRLDRLTRADYISNVQPPPNPPNNAQAQYAENTDINTYGYDAVGNRINETSQTESRTITLTTDADGVTTRNDAVTTNPAQMTTATFNALNELTALNEPDGISNFTYDNNGNLTEISKNNTVISRYEYDVRNQLTAARDGSNNVLARFDYDFERRRIGKTDGLGTATNYIYAGNQVVNEYKNGGLSAKYAVGAGEIVKSEFADGENSFHYTDAVGSVTSLANTGGTLTSRNEYNAFGEITAASGTTANSIGYTGQRLDNETGLMALGNGERYYSPQYARFIQQDSWLGDNTMPQSTNRFAYSYNNPFSYRDMNGNEPDAVQQGIRDTRQELANTSSGNWYLDFAAHFYLSMIQAGYSAIKGFYNAGKEMLSMVADAATYFAADKMGIELKDMKFSSKLAQGIQQQRMSGKSAWDIATDGNVVANVLTLGLYGTIQQATTNVLDYAEGKISLDEYNEKMGEMAGEQIFELATMGVGKGAKAVRAVEEGTTALKTSLKTLATKGDNAVGNLKRSLKEVAGDFAEGYKGRSRGTYMGSGAGGLQDVYEGIENGIKNVINKRNASSATEGITLRAVFQEGMNLRDFNRKVKRLENKIQNGDVMSNIPHGISKAERSAATSAYRRKLTNRIESMYKNRPEMRENALRKLGDSDIDHILDLQLGGTNTRRNFKTLDSRTNQRLGSQFSTQMPRGTRVPIVGIEAVQ